jgi:peptidyl-prolyl cis-trans isomerase A (cyclophilin A)
MTRIAFGCLAAVAAAAFSTTVGADDPAKKPVGSVRVLIRTEKGDIEVELDSAKAPNTAANFLKYVDGGYYDGGRFHRTVTRDNQPDNKVKIEVVQAGVNPEKAKDEFQPIKLERTKDTRLSHTGGTISMARDGPDTATSDFFICIGDQKELDFGGKRNPDGQGFAAFGRVVKGMDVVKKVQQAPADGQTLKPPVKILKVTRRLMSGSQHFGGPGPPEQLADFLVGRLREVLVPQADRVERLRLVGADGLVRLPLELLARLDRPDRDGDHDPGRLQPAQGGHRGPHGRAGGQPVVHQDHRLPPDVQRRPVAAILPLPPVQLPPLLSGNPVDQRLGRLQHLHHPIVEDADAAGGDGPHRQLLVARHAQLADQEHVQRRAQHFRDLVGDRDAAPRQGQH